MSPRTPHVSWLASPVSSPVTTATDPAASQLDQLSPARRSELGALEHLSWW